MSSNSVSTSEEIALAGLLTRWYATHARDLPWRRTRDPYAILVSEFMLQQTTVQVVVPYFERWMSEFPSFAVLARAREEHVLRFWEGLGYYSRAQNLHRLAKLVVKEHQGKLPRDLTLLAGLPGVGPYTCGAVASFAFNLPEPAMDANITRVLARLINYTERCDTVVGRRHLEEFSRRLAGALPKRAGKVNAALMELGALLCRAGEPTCVACPVRAYCRAVNPVGLPLKRPRAVTEKVTDSRAWIVQEQRVLLERSKGPRWRGLWVLPPSVPSGATRVYHSNYQVTKYRVVLEVWQHPEFTGEIPGAVRRWVSFEELSRMPIPAPYRRAIRVILSAEGKEKTGG